MKIIKLKNGAVTLAVAVLVALSVSCVSTAYAKEPPLLIAYSPVVYIDRAQGWADAGIPLKYSDKLRINTSNSFRIAVQKTEQAGIKDLRHLANSASSEEHWVFLPEKNLWLEIGGEENHSHVQIDQDYVEDIIKKNNVLAFYHVHVGNYLKLMKAQGYTGIPETWLILPSLEDMAFMIYYSSRFYEEHPGGEISWHICSPLGTTKYTLTKKGIDHYRCIGDTAFLIRYLYPFHTVHPDTISKSFFDITKPHEVQDLINWANDQGQRYTEIEFAPYKSKVAKATN